MIKKLRIKLIAVSMASLALVLAVILGGIGGLNYHRILTEADGILAILAENGGKFPETGMQPADKKPQNGYDRDGELFSPELPFESRYFWVALNREGDAVTVNTGRIATVDSSAAVQYAREVWEDGSDSGFADKYRYLVYTQGSDTYVIFLDCGRSLDTFRNFVITGIGVSVVGMLAVFLLLIFLSARIVKPFSESYEKQKRFITDAGHELKTPLTVIDADAQVLEMDCGENEWLTDIQKQTKRMAELTNNLIALARMEEEHNRLQMLDFSLSDVVAETAESFQAVVKAQEKSLVTEIQPMISMCGDEMAVRRLITILLDNAVKYSAQGGEVRLTLGKQRNHIHLCVFNTTEYICKEQIKHLFDRFYRADVSRNSQTGGYGLGLSIAAATVKAHKGKITATTADEKSLQITVVFPV